MTVTESNGKGTTTGYTSAACQGLCEQYAARHLALAVLALDAFNVLQYSIIHLLG
jgi:hypothetical protein